MENRNRAENGIIYMGETEFRMLMVRLIVSHKFHNDNQMPKKIVLPAVDEIEGVKIEQEVKDAVVSGKTNS